MNTSAFLSAAISKVHNEEREMEKRNWSPGQVENGAHFLCSGATRVRAESWNNLRLWAFLPSLAEELKQPIEEIGDGEEEEERDVLQRFAKLSRLQPPLNVSECTRVS